jgi:hypothetical protein
MWKLASQRRFTLSLLSSALAISLGACATVAGSPQPTTTPSEPAAWGFAPASVAQGSPAAWGFSPAAEAPTAGPEVWGFVTVPATQRSELWGFATIPAAPAAHPPFAAQR